MDKKEATDGLQRQGHSTRKLKERCVFGVDTQGLEVHWRHVIVGKGQVLLSFGPSFFFQFFSFGPPEKHCQN